MDQIILFWQSMDESTRTLLSSVIIFFGNVFFGNIFFWFLKRTKEPDKISETVQNLLKALDNPSLWQTSHEYISAPSYKIRIYKDGTVMHHTYSLKISNKEAKLLAKKARELRLARYEHCRQEADKECKAAIVCMLKETNS